MSFLRIALSLSLSSIVLAGAGACASNEAADGAGADDANSDTAESNVVSGTPDARQIPVKLTRSVDFMSASNGGSGYCTLAAGEVFAARYEKGQYRVYLPGRRPCASGIPDSFRGWVPADAIAIEDSAYFGKLKPIAADTSIDLAMNYAGDRIFCTGDRCLIKDPLYGQARCYVHPRMEPNVRAAAAKLQARLPGAKLTMFDCYRPIYVQYRMAELVSDPTWVAQPTPPRYGGHNGGIAVDVSIRDAEGNLLDMGSGFDEFTERSRYAASGLTTAQKANRKLLRDVMTAAGLNPYDAEWWHFSLNINAEPLDLAL
jgi:D-alanyl-D-alanine dipeptidase